MSLLQQKGYHVSGGETNDGSDLAIWQLRFDELMEAFFTLDTE